MNYQVLRCEKDSDNPIDAVQTIVWDPFDRSYRSFFTGGWDGVARLYVIEGNSTKRLEKCWEYFFYHPITTMDVTSQRLVIVGLATGQIGVVDANNVANVAIVGSHEATICKIIWIEKYEVLLSFGYDNLIKVFKLKPPQETAVYKLPFKTTTVAYSEPYLLIGTQEGRCALIHFERLNTTNFENEYQSIFDESHGIVKLTCSAIMANRGRMMFGTADGRLITTSFEDRGGLIRISKPVAFRSQKKIISRKDQCGMVNCVELGLRDCKYEFALFCGTFESGMFSTDKNMRIKSISTGDAAVTAISLSPDYEYYAYAFGSDWCKGLEELSTGNAVRLMVGKVTTGDVTSAGLGTSAYLR
jgi:WD40 repeat protein